MSRSFTSLERVLQLEAQQNYQDKAVVGGIRQFAAFWVGQAREEAVDEADRALVEQTAEVLSGYSKLPGTDARKKAVDRLLASLQRRKERLADVLEADSAPEPRSGSQVDALEEAEVSLAKKEKAATPVQQKKVEQAPAQQAVEEPVPVVEQEEIEEIIEPDPEGLRQQVSIIKGVGPKIAQKLEKLGAETIYDLLYLFPRRYDDYTLMKPINRLNYGERVTIIGTIWQTRARCR